MRGRAMAMVDVHAKKQYNVPRYAGIWEMCRMNIHIITLGCPKNTVDSEGMARLLEEAGHRIVPSQQDADIIVVNTCGFIEPASRESLGVIKDVARRKRQDQALIAAGCLVQRYEADLPPIIRAIDGALGTRRWMDIVSLVEQVARERGLPAPKNGRRPRVRAPLDRSRRPCRPSAYLKIADGCDRPCAFCTIPSIKGRFQSRPVEHILAEASRLAHQGVREIVLVAQETTYYGRDDGHQHGIVDLLRRFPALIPQVPWLRLMYAHPSTVTLELLEAWAEHPQLVRYLDMPLQHAHPDVLRRMRRPHNIEQTYRLIEDIRRILPGVALRTTFIVGFPGETEAEFTTLLDFMQAVEFDRVGIFTYSQEEGTPANALPNQIPEPIKRERYSRAMLVQQEISRRKNSQWIGQELTVLVEGETIEPKKRGERPLVVGRSYRDAPEIDGLVLAWGEAQPGDLVRVRITQATEYDLWGEVVGPVSLGLERPEQAANGGRP